MVPAPRPARPELLCQVPGIWRGLSSEKNLKPCEIYFKGRYNARFRLYT